MRHLVVIAFLLASSHASAQPASPTDSERARAEAQFRQGEAFYKEGLYDQAIAAFRESYRLSGLSELLVNIAQAQRLAGRKQQALDTYKTFLAENPKHRYADEVRRLVAILTKEVEDQEKAAAIEAARQKQATQAAPPPAARPAVVDDRQPAREGGSELLRYSGVAVGVTGLVLTGFGVKFAFDARGHEDALSENDGQWTEDLLDRIDDGERAERNAIVFLSTGAGAVALGAALYYLGLDRGGMATMAVNPTAGGGTVSFGARF
ncbi:MAG: tetratricopeptide repeat protein [Deltaproteobacteria bacterium]|nr:tetratricopeptide repeat protein [Deltaproteobacteria bacterium]